MGRKRHTSSPEGPRQLTEQELDVRVRSIQVRGLRSNTNFIRSAGQLLASAAKAGMLSDEQASMFEGWRERNDVVLPELVAATQSVGELTGLHLTGAYLNSGRAALELAEIFPMPVMQQMQTTMSS